MEPGTAHANLRGSEDELYYIDGMHSASPLSSTRTSYHDRMVSSPFPGPRIPLMYPNDPPSFPRQSQQFDIASYHPLPRPEAAGPVSSGPFTSLPGPWLLGLEDDSHVLPRYQQARNLANYPTSTNGERANQTGYTTAPALPENMELNTRSTRSYGTMVNANYTGTPVVSGNTYSAAPSSGSYGTVANADYTRAPAVSGTTSSTTLATGSYGTMSNAERASQPDNTTAPASPVRDQPPTPSTPADPPTPPAPESQATVGEGSHPAPARARAGAKRTCAECGETFKTAGDLRQHTYAEHHEEGDPLGPVRCTVCGKLYKNDATMTSHRQKLHVSGSAYRKVIQKYQSTQGSD
ncbi:hypothetical protein F5B20DRAFT_578168 [Whalleya microplaca]|nr:hypothetical protein F5B20DRAFT_578168 [Whalleya microplaca]